jgi:hypothetical protein
MAKIINLLTHPTDVDPVLEDGERLFCGSRNVRKSQDTSSGKKNNGASLKIP